MIRTGILTVSDKGSRNERIDGTGPAIKNVLDENLYVVEYYKIIPDEMDLICEELIHMSIPEAMRQMSLAITPKAMLSRAAAGIRDNTLIINLPGSPKGAVENLSFVLSALPHGIEILKGTGGECAG